MTILQGNSSSIAQKSGEIWTAQADLQPILFKSDRLLGTDHSPHPKFARIQAMGPASLARSRRRAEPAPDPTRLCEPFRRRIPPSEKPLRYGLAIRIAANGGIRTMEP